MYYLYGSVDFNLFYDGTVDMETCMNPSDKKSA